MNVVWLLMLISNQNVAKKTLAILQQRELIRYIGRSIPTIGVQAKRGQKLQLYEFPAPSDDGGSVFSTAISNQKLTRKCPVFMENTRFFSSAVVRSSINVCHLTPLLNMNSNFWFQ